MALGGPGIVPEFLSKLPAEAGVQYEPAELEGYATRMSQMTPPPVSIVEGQLSSPQWFKRVIALRFIERRGTEGDLAKMQRLTGDRSEVLGEGWSRREVDTVGKAAEAAIAALRERLANPAAQDTAANDDGE